MNDSYLTLRYAVVNNDIETIEQLLLSNKDIDINIGDQRGETLLHVAVRFGRTGILKLLLENPKIDVNIVDQWGERPLHVAVRVGRIDTLELLLEHPKIDVNIRNRLGSTPLSYYITSAEQHTRIRPPFGIVRANATIMKMLLQHGATMVDVDQQKSFFYKSIRCNDESLLMDVLVAGLDTQPDDETDWLNEISSDVQRDRLKTARSNLAQQVQFLFAQETLDAREVPKRLRLLSQFLEDLKEIKALETPLEEALALQTARYKACSHTMLKSLAEFKESEEKYCFYRMQVKTGLVPDVMLQVLEYLYDPQHTKKLMQKYSLERGVIKRLYFDLKDPDSELSRFDQTRFKRDWSVQESSKLNRKG